MKRPKRQVLILLRKTESLEKTWILGYNVVETSKNPHIVQSSAVLSVVFLLVKM